VGTASARSRRHRRDRHGRGLRGPLAPATSPASITRTDRFGDLVADAVDRLQPRWSDRLQAVDIEIVDSPPVSAQDVAEGAEVVLAECRTETPAPGGRPVAVVTVYRRPVELRAPDRPARVDLLRDLVAEQLAEVLGVAPGDLDPGYDERGGGSGD
jgi:hypothetical protein